MAIDLEKLLADTRGGGSFLAKDEKNALVDSQTPFVIVGAEPKREQTSGPYPGVETHFHIRIKGEDDVRTLSVSHNASRENLANAVLKLIADGEQYVGPFYLTRVATGKGNPYYEFATEPASSTPKPLPKASDAKAKTPAGRVDSDDGNIPW